MIKFCNFEQKGKNFVLKKMDKDNSSLVVVEVFNDRMEAHVYRTKLISFGIDAVVIDDTTMSVLPLNNGAFGGGAKLLVREADFNQALTIINDRVGDFDDEYMSEI